MSRNNYKKKDLRAIIQKIFDSQKDRKFNYKQISAILQLKNKNERKLVLSVLNDLKNEGFLNEFQRGHFILNEKYTSAYQGVVDATTRGTAYIIIDDLEHDVFIPHNGLNHALDGDTVEVSITRKSNNRIEGIVTKIVERKTTHFVGTLDIRKKFAFLVTDDKKVNIDLYIPLNKLKEGKQGQKAVARMTSWPKDIDNPYGEIIEILGDPGDVNTEMSAILAKNQFSSKFPDDVEKAAKEIGIELDPEEIKNRKDCRDKLTFTIDPVDAKDYDDALSFEILENGNYEIGIHIADVSFYVQPDSPIDKEAYNRGNSVYLEDRVIPMLPEELSNVACSLRPNEDKYAFSAIFELNNKGKVLNEWFGKTVIRSDKRFAYEDAQAIIEGQESEYQEAILTMDKIAKNIREKRIKEGALAIESEELRFVLDDEGTPIKVEKRIIKDSNKLIEEFMLLANRRVALFVGKLPDNKGSNREFIYRCHDVPDVEKLNTFSVFIDKFGYNLELTDVNDAAKKMNILLEKIKGTPEFDLIQVMAIRSMQKAVYQTNNIGHYGLGFKYYSHFTSPIRRYADLTVHRIVLDKLNNRKKSYGNRLNEISKHISAQEKKAIEAERESNKFFQAKYLMNKIGEVYEGTVSGLADFGLFVKINENSCEGMIRIQALPDDTYFFNPDKFQIIGRQTKYTYNFGDQVKVKVKAVDLLKKEIDLEIVS